MNFWDFSELSLSFGVSSMLSSMSSRLSSGVSSILSSRVFLEFSTMLFFHYDLQDVLRVSFITSFEMSSWYSLCPLGCSLWCPPEFPLVCPTECPPWGPTGVLRSIYHNVLWVSYGVSSMMSYGCPTEYPAWCPIRLSYGVSSIMFHGCPREYPPWCPTGVLLYEWVEEYL